MRHFRVRINGHDYATAVDRINENELKATTEETVLQTTLARRGEISTWLIDSGIETIRAHSHVVNAERITVWIAGLPFDTRVQVLGAGGYDIQSAQMKRVESGEIKALMPGRITTLLVRQGDPVDIGTPLLILEAMKMQNEIVSPKRGNVKSVRVREGETVKKDTVLMELS